MKNHSNLLQLFEFGYLKSIFTFSFQFNSLFLNCKSIKLVQRLKYQIFKGDMANLWGVEFKFQHENIDKHIGIP